ncbi:uncharacterized protein LOC121390039 isoform X2 [Gigantopelta aegis]|uniref:uncharacterized protein LOC121390039 isoform X2 n=1 Tax=Gigantopelta aegis TaxID=1735272 RepID=UPI001B888BA9|nr:uncharacterized protein LOC121390039 isoform X2 [Gigantopelta aegis]
MTDFGQTVAWLVLSPIAFITSVLAIVIVAHYKPFFHAIDIALLSLFATMALNSAILLPVPAVVYLRQATWDSHLCNFYVWATITFRVAELLGLMYMSFHWIAVLRCPPDKKWYGSTKVTKFVLLGIWFLAILAGILPSIGAGNDSLADKENHCRFLPYDLGDGFAMFFLLLTLFAMCMCFICSLDTMMLLRHMKRVAVVKYHAGRFCLPPTSLSSSSSSSVATPSVNQTAHSKYNELTFSADLCRLLICVITISACVNHFPYIIIQFMQLVQTPNRKSSEAAVLWLLLLETLTLPHALWLVSKRYRHALVYTWKVYIVRDTAAEEEDATACTLQSYTRRVRDEDGTLVKITARANGRQTVNVGNRGRAVTNGTPHRMNGHGSTTHTPNHYDNVKENGRATEIFTTDLDDGMTVITNTRSGQVHYITDGSSNNSKTGARGSTSASTTPSKSSSTLGTPSRGQDLRRSSSARLEWKEQMRRKHLPAIFVNEAFDTEDLPPSPEKVMNSPKKHSHKVSDLSLYYMSSDYHPDHLVDLAPKLQHQESEGVCNQYDDKDFEYLLDDANAVADTSMSKDIEQAFHSVLLSESLKSGPDDEKVVEGDLQGKSLRCEADDDVFHNGVYSHSLNRQANVASEQDIFVGGLVDSGTNENNIKTEFGSTSSFETMDNNMEPRSESSDRSVTIEPYTEGRRPPWMDEDFDSSFSAMVEPLIGESDTDTLKDSNGSSVFEMMAGGSEQCVSSVSSPPQFDEETDRGFEAALAYNYAYGHSTSLGLCFESIKEEPEETVGDNRSPFGDDEELSAIFKTQAVVSSRPSSRADFDQPSERPSVRESTETLPMNGSAESVDEKEMGQVHSGAGDGYQYYNDQAARFGMFYDSSYPEESGDRCLLTDTENPAKSSVNSRGNIEESTSFRTAESVSIATDNCGHSGHGASIVTDSRGDSGDAVSIVTNSYDQSNDFITNKQDADPYANIRMSTFGTGGGNPFVENSSADTNGHELDSKHNHDPFQPDPKSSHDRMRSQLPERKEVSYNGFSAWPEEDIEMSDMSFDSDFSSVSNDKSNPSETQEPSSVIGQKNKSALMNNLSPQTNDSDVHTAFF